MVMAMTIMARGQHSIERYIPYLLFYCPILDIIAIAINYNLLNDTKIKGRRLCVYVFLTIILLFFPFLIFIIRCWQGGGR